MTDTTVPDGKTFENMNYVHIPDSTNAVPPQIDWKFTPASATYDEADQTIKQLAAAAAALLDDFDKAGAETEQLRGQIELALGAVALAHAERDL